MLELTLSMGIYCCEVPKGTCIAQCEATRTAKGYVSAVQLHREAGIHGNGNRNLIGSRVGYCYTTDRARDPQVIFGKVEARA